MCRLLCVDEYDASGQKRKKTRGNTALSELGGIWGMKNDGSKVWKQSARRRITAALLVMTMSLGMVACNSGDAEATKKKKKSKESAKTESVDREFRDIADLLPNEENSDDRVHAKEADDWESLDPDEESTSIPEESTSEEENQFDPGDTNIPGDTEDPEGTEDTEKWGDPIDSPDPEQPTSAEGYVLDNQVIVDNDICRVTLISIVPEETGLYTGFAVRVKCENKTQDKHIWFFIESAVVNGYSVDSQFLELLDPQSKTLSDLHLSGAAFETGVLTSVDKLSFNLSLTDGEDFFAPQYLNQDFIIYPTSLAEDKIEVPERPKIEGETVLVDNDQFTLIIYSSGVNEMWGYETQIYVENKTDRLLRVEFQDFHVNGLELDPFWLFTIPGGTHKITNLRIYDIYLDANDITKVEKLDFTLDVRERNTSDVDALIIQHFEYVP